MGFSHLHVHTEYSLLDGFITLDDLVRVTYEHGQRVVASTDHGSLASSYKLHEACERLRKDLIDDGSLDPDAALPVVPMYGIEAYMAIGSRFEREMITVPRDSSDTDNYESTSTASHKTKRYNHLTLLAINATGWCNLQAAHRKSFDTVWGKHPRMDYDLLREHSEGIVVLTGCLAGPVAGPVHRGNVDEARDHLATLIDIFGTENTYVELMDHGIDSETAITPTLVELAEEAGVKCVATNDCHYTREEDSDSHEAWLAIQSGSTLDNPKRFRFNGGGYYLKSESQMRDIRDEDWWQLACDNTVALSERLPGDIMPEPTRRLPQFPVPDDFVVPVKRAKKKKHSQLTNSSVPWTRADHFLFQKVNDGAKTRYGQSLPDAVKQRVLDEFTVISGMGFSDYFLIVDDIITWARSNGIAVGPGRGSAAGSVVSYALGIVNVDPLRFHLLFERFLEPGRPDYPDIDVDFEKRHRDKVIAYISSRWGADMVAKIGTYGVSLGKDAFQKAARILDRSDLIPLSKKLPVHGGKPISLHAALDPANKEAGEFRRTVKVEAGDDFERVIELAQEFEGIRWANGIHACGVIVSDNPLTGLVPMRVDTKSADNPERAGYSVTEWEGPDLEGFGLLKMDILGLKNLDIFVTAAESIRSQTGEAINLLTDVPDPDDASNPRVSRIWDLVSAGKTAGLFQLESSGMTDVCESVAPQSLEDLSAVIALFRPGPISAGMPELYADRKWGRSAVDYTIYTNDSTEQNVIASVLDDTYGCIVYQEQLMRLGAAVAGFDASWRAKLRRAVGKKKKGLMDLVGEKFIDDATKEMTLSDGTKKPAFAAETADRLWEHFKGSADYIFNASHTYAYAQLAYSGAYLKANWPAHYGAAILAVTNDDSKRRAAIVSLVQEGIQIASPDVNRSQAKTVALSDTEIIIGLSEIKDVGKVVADLITEREDNGEFTDFADFMSRCPSSVNVAALQSLIQAGALDRFGPRKAMLSVSRAARALPEIRIGSEEFTVVERAKREREKAGLVVASNHPMTLLDVEIASWKDAHSSQKSFAGLNRIARGSDGDRVAVVAVLSDWDVRWTKAGTSQYARFTIEDGHESINGVAFQKTLTALEAMKSNLEPGDLVKVSGNVSVNERFTSGEVGGDEGLDEPTFEIAREIKAFEIVPVRPDDTPIPDDEPVDLSALLALHGFGETITTDSDSSTPTEKPDSGADELDTDDEEHFDEEQTEGRGGWAPVATSDDDDDWEVVGRVDEPLTQPVIESQPTESTLHTEQAASTNTGEAADPSAAALSLMQRIPADSLSFFTGPGLGDDNGRAVHFFIHDDRGVRVTRSESELGLSPRQMRPLRMAAAAGVGFDLSPGIYALPITGAHENHNLVLVVFDRDLEWPDPNVEPETLTYDMVSAGGEVIVDIGMQVIRMAPDSGIKEASLAPSRSTSDSRGSTTSTRT